MEGVRPVQYKQEHLSLFTVAINDCIIEKAMLCFVIVF